MSRTDAERLRGALVIPGYTFTMKTAISIPDETFRRSEERAAQLGMNRSEFFATAALRYLEQLDSESLTARLDEAIARSGQPTHSREAGLARLAAITADDEW